MLLVQVNPSQQAEHSPFSYRTLHQKSNFSFSCDDPACTLTGRVWGTASKCKKYKKQQQQLQQNALQSRSAVYGKDEVVASSVVCVQ